MTGIVPYRTVPYYTPYGNTYRVLITAVPCGTYYKYCTGVQAGGYQNALFLCAMKKWCGASQYQYQVGTRTRYVDRVLRGGYFIDKTSLRLETTLRRFSAHLFGYFDCDSFDSSYRKENIYFEC